MAGLPEGIEFCMAIEDYSDEMNNICLHKEESVIVLDKLSFPGMYKVLKFHSDGSSGDEIWVPENILQRKTSTAEITLAKGKLSLFNRCTCFFLDIQVSLFTTRGIRRAKCWMFEEPFVNNGSLGPRVR